ncbi:ATP-dependent RNA helicase dbp10, partial [Ascosphaera pollenicola]
MGMDKALPIRRLTTDANSFADYGYDNQYSTTSYGGQGGMTGGGGFVAEGQSSQSEGKSRYTKESLRPVTLKQVADATQAHPDADFKIDGQDVSHISFVGQVRNISNATTFNTYRIDDGTAENEVRVWKNSDNLDVVDAFEEDANDHKQPYSDIELNGYVKGFGKINALTTSTTSPRPLSGPSRVLTKATAVHLYFTRGPPPSKQQQQQQQAGVKSEFGAQNGSGDYSNGAARALPPMSASARRVYQLLSNSPETNEGVHIQNMSSTLGMPVDEVFRACDELTSGSLIYSTIDEETFA